MANGRPGAAAVDDVTRRRHYRNAYRTLRSFSTWRPAIVKQNDTVATEETGSATDDRLAACRRPVDATCWCSLRLDALYTGKPPTVLAAHPAGRDEADLKAIRIAAPALRGRTGAWSPRSSRRIATGSASRRLTRPVAQARRPRGVACSSRRRAKTTTARLSGSPTPPAGGADLARRGRRPCGRRKCCCRPHHRRSTARSGRRPGRLVEAGSGAPVAAAGELERSSCRRCSGRSTRNWRGPRPGYNEEVVTATTVAMKRPVRRRDDWSGWENDRGTAMTSQQATAARGPPSTAPPHPGREDRALLLMPTAGRAHDDIVAATRSTWPTRRRRLSEAMVERLTLTPPGRAMAAACANCRPARPGGRRGARLEPGQRLELRQVRCRSRCRHHLRGRPNVNRRRAASAQVGQRVCCAAPLGDDSTRRRVGAAKAVHAGLPAGRSNAFDSHQRDS